MLSLYLKITNQLAIEQSKNERCQTVRINAGRRVIGWRHLLTLVGSLGTILVVLCITAIANGHGDPTLKVISSLGRCADSPCFDGIIPGVTPWIALQEKYSTLRNSLVFGDQ